MQRKEPTDIHSDLLHKRRQRQWPPHIPRCPPEHIGRDHGAARPNNTSCCWKNGLAVQSVGLKPKTWFTSQNGRQSSCNYSEQWQYVIGVFFPAKKRLQVRAGLESTQAAVDSILILSLVEYFSRYMYVKVSCFSQFFLAPFVKITPLAVRFVPLSVVFW